MPPRKRDPKIDLRKRRRQNHRAQCSGITALANKSHADLLSPAALASIGGLMSRCPLLRNFEFGHVTFRFRIEIADHETHLKTNAAVVSTICWHRLTNAPIHQHQPFLGDQNHHHARSRRAAHHAGDWSELTRTFIARDKLRELRFTRGMVAATAICCSAGGLPEQRGMDYAKLSTWPLYLIPKRRRPPPSELGQAVNQPRSGGRGPSNPAWPMRRLSLRARPTRLVRPEAPLRPPPEGGCRPLACSPVT
jgi:hypothetical protein